MVLNHDVGEKATKLLPLSQLCHSATLVQEVGVVVKVEI